MVNSQWIAAKYAKNFAEEKETYLEKIPDRFHPRSQHYDSLKHAESLLKTAITENDDPSVVMEAFLLLAKLHYFCANFPAVLHDIEKSRLDGAKTQFTTLRSLKLAAEGYAVKGFSIEKTNQNGKYQAISLQRMLNCFETAAELSISYITELEKTLNSSSRNSLVSASSSGYGTLPRGSSNIPKIGELLEISLERVPHLYLHKNYGWDSDGVEWYRRIMTALSDKSMVEQLQQRLCRQLAEVLLRGMLDGGYDVSSHSKAINLKSESLNFYTGSNKNYFAPSSRIEEVILLLLISEVIASREVKMEKKTSDGDEFDKHRAIHNVKMVHNLLAMVLSNLRQYHLMSTFYERAMKFSSQDRFIWLQFALSLICSGRASRAAKNLQHCVNIEAHDENACLEHMLIAKLHIEQLGDYNLVLEHAAKAIELAKGTWLNGRCRLLYALGFSLKTQSEVSFALRKLLLSESIQHFVKAVELDPHDELAHLYTALEYALARDVDLASEHCQISLEKNPEQPAAIMLMALLFSARKDYKSALELVIGVLKDFPDYYGLLVLRLKLETKFGRVEEALNISKHLLNFWRKMPANYNEFFHEDETITQTQQNGFDSSVKGTDSVAGTATRQGPVQMSSKDALGTVTPIFSAPLGISAPSYVSLSNAAVDVTDNASVLASMDAKLSEYGGAASTISESIGILSSSSRSWTMYTTFRIQANIWVELAELFLEMDRVADVQACVEEACNIFQNSHQAIYLKGRLFQVRANKIASQDAALSKRLQNEAKSCFLGALSLFPAHIPSLKSLADIYRREGNMKMAEKMFCDIINIEPLDSNIWHQLGRILAEQARFEEANECFDTANSLDTNTPIIPFSVIPRLIKPTFI
uniref:Tetratricopeptide repeat protein 7 N-terminal domain-containing protein n=1 Tax=Acrobeloides nanus TaxID=290746 RepID=A0A914CD93_9BILA